MEYIGFFLLFFLSLYLLCWLLSRFITTANRRKNLPFEEWTETEKINFILAAYRNGQLTCAQKDVAIAKIKKQQSVTELAIKAGVASPTGISSSVPNKPKDNGTKTIIKDAVIGGVVAGGAGAVVGAVVGKNKVDNKNTKQE